MQSRENNYNYTAKTAVTQDNNYTCPKAGLIFAFGEEGYNTKYIAINDVNFPWIYHYGSGYSSGEVMFPVKKGDVINIQRPSGKMEVSFIPLN